ncbi:hypothetical protein BTA51_05025 [Hahella sp. CCB-MM4]|uniref:hypothetical protein n=1 Tax=Hahella sp. (strain CCB-MM4) TaxID=1926491 RepID=UPI000B9BF949|nr:hypothetical protein [Hahella sp. CCB-MM4]OZG74376.1 hypothetical protein BTA51_05025 [Hahella sp. CCB-MM4]
MAVLSVVLLTGKTCWAAGKDSVDLESTFVGDREQPSVSYFIPWKPPEGPEKLYRSITSVSGKVFEVVDRDIHSRTMQFYNELKLEQPADSNN